MAEWLGLGAALLGSFLGGTASAGTRYAVGAIDPLAVVALRYGIGALFLLPFAARSLRKVRGNKDVYAVAALGAAFFGLYPYLFALAFACIAPMSRASSGEAGQTSSPAPQGCARARR